MLSNTTRSSSVLKYDPTIGIRKFLISSADTKQSSISEIFSVRGTSELWFSEMGAATKFR